MSNPQFLMLNAQFAILALLLPAGLILVAGGALKGRRPAQSAVAGLGALARQQFQGFDEQRFSGPGLAGKDGEPAVKPDVEIIDDREIFYGEFKEHKSLVRAHPQTASFGPVRRFRSFGILEIEKL